MATCPNCGRPISDTIYYSLSESNRLGGAASRRCDCGYTITYQQQGYRPPVQQGKKGPVKKQEQLKPGYRKFAFTLIGSVFLLLSFWFIYRIVTDEGSVFGGIVMAIIMLCFSGLVTLLLSLLAVVQPTYLPDADEKTIRKKRRGAAVAHVFGCLLLIAALAGCVYLILFKL